jgi:flagellar biosynthesis/type III secretory pathway chaperone
MTEHTMLDAAAALAEVLEAENAALAAMDIPSANRLLDAKRTATDALLKANRAVPPPPTPAAQAIGLRLRDLAHTNKTLLERAMVAQNRVMACIARAIPRSVNHSGSYGAHGGPAALRSMPPVALSSRV